MKNRLEFQMWGHGDKLEDYCNNLSKSYDGFCSCGTNGGGVILYPEYILIVGLRRWDDLEYEINTTNDDFTYCHGQCRMKVVLFTEIGKKGKEHISFWTFP